MIPGNHKNIKYEIYDFMEIIEESYKNYASTRNYNLIF